MSVRTWLGIGGSDAQGLLRALRSLSSSHRGQVWSDLVLQVDEPADLLLKGLPQAVGLAAPPGWPSELPAGFHPLQLDGLHVLVCIGPLPDTLGELVCHAHSVWVSGSAMPQFEALGGQRALQHTLSRLARCCAGHADLTLSGNACNPAWETGLQKAGFKPASLHHTLTWTYQPPWPLPSHRSVPLAERRVVVVGAGLAGAATAWALVRRGWQVHVLDAHPASAMGASGLPVGVMTEHQASNDTVLSALSRVGVPLHIRELTERVPIGNGWQPTVVANLKDLPPDAVQPVQDVLTRPTLASRRQQGALVRPSALVQAWLSAARQTGRLVETWGSAVTGLDRSLGASSLASEWRVQFSGGRPAAHAPFVVLASAFGTQSLLSPHMPAEGLPIRPVKGQLTHGALSGEPLAPCPIRHQGVWVPTYTDAGLSQPRSWAVGSTYERGQNNTECRPESRAANLNSLHSLSPAAHNRALEHPISDWAGVRCASLDRLPLAGQLPASGHVWRASDRLEHIPREPGLWTVCALGSRGLTLAALLGEWVAAQMSGAPWPLTRSHAMALDPARFALRHTRKSG